MKKDECEAAIRTLATTWARERNIDVKVDHPSFSDFKEWLRQKGYSHYLDFRSVAGSEYDAEMWFDQELDQTWRR